jgi:cytidylate kinase
MSTTRVSPATLPENPAPSVRFRVPSNLPIIVTIDGPAGTGKSSVARALAKRLGLDFLDTGAMYRAAAAIVIDHGLDWHDTAAVVEAVERADLRFDWSCDPPSIQAWGRTVDARIRDADVTGVVSPIAGIGPLRELMVEKQREIARQHRRLVTEGRDQGSVVFPEAPVKIFLDAAPEVRAARRAEQLRAAGHPADEARLLDEIVQRDRSDSTRRDGPLICPADAERVDTSGLTFDEVVGELEGIVRSRVAALL